jgi:hypothetical protein
MTGNWLRSGLSAMGGDVPTSAAVLWGAATASLSGTQLTMSGSTAGSSLVAIKKGETILWSYLLWVTDTAPEELPLPNGKEILPPLGGALYFQWGRKDPLQPSLTRTENQGTSGLSYSIAHPTQFIKGVDTAYDWYCTYQADQDATLWGDGGVKTVWDPCPQGYRVPSAADFTDVDKTYVIANFAELGYLHNTDNYYTSRTYWSRTVSGFSATALDDTQSTEVLLGQTRNIAAPIRCVRE